MRVPELFVNYVRNPRRDSPINVGVARVIFGTYLLWNFGSMDFGAIDEWHLMPGAGEYLLFQPPVVQQYLPVEKAVLVVFLLAFLVGYRQRLTALVSALLVAHLATVMNAYVDSGRVNSMFIAGFFLIFFGLYAETDRLNVDTVRRALSESIDDLNETLRSPNTGEHSMRILQLVLLTIAILYFGSAWTKLVFGSDLSLDWISATALGRWATSALVYWDPPTQLGEFMLRYPLLLTGAALGTIVFELGLLVAVLVGLPITPLLLGTLGMHTVIALSLGPFFFDQYVFLALLLPWDSLFRYLGPDEDETIDLVYDEHCYFCARSLYSFKLLDFTNAVRFHSQYTVPDRYRGREDVSFEDAMYAFDGEDAYAGYDAFRRLAKQFPVLVPLSWVMSLGPVARVGRRVYRYVAENRSRHFTCAVDADADTSATEE
ncbi:DCC1-like thiol-disulfide oxidoreductase family protein [Halogeometricum sp. S1BR25-6]|uniref:DCC1-like thiol-disulfide oxidoreductase family protein n=1 Tax=Halogeometricum salsisoli TaxID=2950536 RepID=A0ABU2G8U8_9EURY|nr:DCC1-like thiol-disulfide oxidoreductase family protein [Halogeometricum sp. S1BR25-6]MDS0297235.1 DCC1-like thiol-disulfide oxidoreductase family protein [Halogeometricum sp. S1BR25-6]